MVNTLQDISKDICTDEYSMKTKNMNRKISLPGLNPGEEYESDDNTKLIIKKKNSKTCHFGRIFKTILFYGFCTVLIVVPFTYDISELSKIPKTLEDLSWLKFIKYELKKPTDTSLQTRNPEIYSEILKELRHIQEAAMYLQQKQLLIEEKTTMLQNELRSYLKNPGETLNDRKVKNLIKEALDIHDADKLGLRDYALESAGGSIVSTPDTLPYFTEVKYIVLGYFTFHSPSNPRLIIQPDVQPGRCFAFKGKEGRIRIKLANQIHITAVTMEHCSASLLTNEEITSAPQEFELKGLSDEYDKTGIKLGNFKYSLENSPVQTFLVSDPEYSTPFLYTELHIKNNHGNSDYTCLYRIRIHGER